MNSKLRLMSLFVQVVESGSISKAAEKLDLSKSVISTALKQLEQELEICLLKRTTRKQSLTPAGERFYQQCAQMTQQAEAAWLEAADLKQIPSGTFTVTAPNALMSTIVLPALSKLFARYPDVHLNFISDDQHVDIVQQDIDLAVRVGESSSSSLKQRKVGQFRDQLCQATALPLAPCKAPYIAQQWQNETIEHTFVSDSSDKEVEFVVKHRANTVSDVVSLLTLGLGIGVVPEFMLKSNSAIKPVPDVLPSKVNSVYVLHPYQAHTPIAVTMAIKAIEAKMAEVMTK